MEGDFDNAGAAKLWADKLKHMSWYSLEDATCAMDGS